jgi:chromosome segregation ATPase
MDEEVVLLEEQITSLQADIEALQSRLADAEALATGREGDIARLRRELADSQNALSERDATAGALTSEVQALRSAVDASTEQGRQTSSRYRELLLAKEPDLPADLVSGETIDDIDASAERARQTVSQVRQRFEAQAQATRVPAGAPARGGQDTSSLSAAEKIRLGLQQGH